MKNSAARVLPTGSVLISSRAPVGYCVVAAQPVATNQGFKSLVLKGGCDPFFIRYYVLASRKYLEENASGTTFKELSGGAMSQLVFPVPPLEIQRQIVARIDELFAEIDEGERALLDAREAMASYDESLFFAAVVGTLSRQRRGGAAVAETVEVFLQQLAAAAGAGLRPPQKKLHPAAALTLDDLPEIPSSWKWVVVGDIGKVITGATPPTSQPAYYNGDVPFFTPGDLDTGDGLVDTRRHLTRAGLERVRAIPARSVMVTCIGATIGKTGLNEVPGATNQQINTIVPKDPRLADYLFAYFRGPLGRSLVIQSASSTTLPILNKGDFARLPVPLPLPQELEEITGLLAAHRKLKAEASAELQGAFGAPATLRQSILAAAFRGDLVA